VIGFADLLSRICDSFLVFPCLVQRSFCILLFFPAAGDSFIEVKRSAHRFIFKVFILFLAFQCIINSFFTVFMVFFSFAYSGRQWGSGSSADFIYHMKQIRRMMGVQAFGHMMDQSLAFITGALDNFDGKMRKSTIHGLVPGASRTVIGIFFKDNIVGVRLNTDKADLRMKGFVFTKGYQFLRHLQCKTRLFHITKLAYHGVHLIRNLLMSAVGCRDKI